MNYIEINKSLIPYRQDVKIEGKTFGFVFRYNGEGDFFTCDLYRGEELLAAGEKLVYGSPLFSAYADINFPKAALVPLDFSGVSDKVAWQTLERDVFLYIVTQEDVADV